LHLFYVKNGYIPYYDVDFSRVTENMEIYVQWEIAFEFDTFETHHMIKALKTNYVLNTLTIPEFHEGLPIIGIDENAFAHQPHIVHITLSRFIRYISGQLFADLPVLENIYVAPSNAYFKSIDGVLYNATETVLYAYPAYHPISYTLQPLTVEIMPYAFYNNKSLQTVVFGDQLKTIGDFAFSNAEMLFEVYINGFTNYRFRK
jgi:hypothetical protein